MGNRDKHHSDGSVTFSVRRDPTEEEAAQIVTARNGLQQALAAVEWLLEHAPSNECGNIQRRLRESAEWLFYYEAQGIERTIDEWRALGLEVYSPAIEKTAEFVRKERAA